MQPAQYPVRWLLVSLAAMLCVAFFPYIFEGKIFLSTDMFDTMTAPFNAHYGPPQAQNFYPFDGIVQTYPYKVETQEALRRGQLAYWNPHILCGYPQYAETMGNNFDIFNALLLWLSATAFIHWQTVLELFLAGAGMILLLRFFGVSPIANLIFSSAYMLNSLFIASALHRWTVASFCWVPLVVLMLLRYFHYGGKENLLYASLLLALAYLGGNLQTSFFASCVVGGVILLFPFGDHNGRFIGRIGALCFVGALAFALSSIMWLPTLELFLRTLSQGSLNSSSVYSEYTLLQRMLSIPYLVIFYFPSVIGSPEIFNLKKLAGVDATDFNGAITFLPALFALWGCFVLRKRRTVRPFILLAVLALFLPICTPLFTVLYHRVYIIASFSLTVIGAVAFQSMLEDDDGRRSFARFLRPASMAFGVFVLGLIGLCIAVAVEHEMLGQKLATMLHARPISVTVGGGREGWSFGRIAKTLHYYSFTSVELWLPIVLGAIALLALLRYSSGKLGRRAMLGISFVSTFAALLLFVRMWLPSIDPVQFPVFPPNSVATFLQTHAPDGRYINWRNADSDNYVLPSNASNAYHIDDFNGYESLTIASMSTLYRQSVHNPSPDLRLLGLANLKYLVTAAPNMASADLSPVFSADGVTIYENRLAKPRTYVVHKSRVLASDSSVRQELLRSEFDGSEALFAAHDAHPEAMTSEPVVDTVVIRKAGNEEMEIEANTAAKGILILTDSYYPGWKCWVNGRSRPIYRANNYMRAVTIEAGTSTVVFRFEPAIFRAGAIASALALLFSLAAILFLKVRR